jgi:hypothetical protein
MAMLFDDAHEGLTAADFDVYARPCWSNNQFNLGRMRAKARLKYLCAPLTALPGADALTLESTAEVPGVWNGRCVQDQWVYLIRPPALRQQLAPLIAARVGVAAGVREPADHQHHATVFARLHHDGLEVGFRLPRGAMADRETLAARLRDPDARARLDAALHALPAALTIDREPAATAFRPVFDALQAEIRADLRLAVAFDRAHVVGSGPSLTDAVAALWAPCLAIYACVAFDPQHDSAGLSSQVDGHDRARAAAEAEAAEFVTARAHERQAREAAARARATERAEAEAAWRRRRAPTGGGTEPAPGRPLPPQTPPPPSPPALPPSPAPPASPASPAGPVAAPSTPPVVGATVHLTRGLLAGRAGTVTGGPDPKGYFKVRVGTLEVQVPGAELRTT